MPSKILIACGIFADELKAVLPEGAADVIWLDPTLHAEPAKLAQQLNRVGIGAKQRAGQTGCEVRLLIGSGCHPDMYTLAQACGSCPAPFKNCIEAFVGRHQQELEANRTMLITPGWVRSWPGLSSPLGWDATDMRTQHGRYDRILLLDPGINPVSDEEILNLFDLLQVPIEVEPLDLGHFKETLLKILGT